VVLQLLHSQDTYTQHQVKSVCSSLWADASLMAIQVGVKVIYGSSSVGWKVGDEFSLIAIHLVLIMEVIFLLVKADIDFGQHQ
jgi:hypothetical protein